MTLECGAIKAASCLPLYDPIKDRIPEVSLVDPCLITVPGPVFGMSFSRHKHHGVRSACVHIFELISGYIAWNMHYEEMVV